MNAPNITEYVAGSFRDYLLKLVVVVNKTIRLSCGKLVYIYMLMTYVCTVHTVHTILSTVPPGERERK